ncbi:hypothetical protein BB560_004615 [Smittium megazygosporum]|uniref:Rapamycin-insensitive companion of mTOR domain-containing protein n=1 Tax=Smittium megazygosporum TaxID=133381 RepID=A0A2T9Z8R6_9FUNG|nr:hypothetical protein BB560_004615 [Smittium megazygosporum]
MHNLHSFDHLSFSDSSNINLTENTNEHQLSHTEVLLLRLSRLKDTDESYHIQNLLDQLFGHPLNNWIISDFIKSVATRTIPILLSHQNSNIRTKIYDLLLNIIDFNEIHLFQNYFELVITKSLLNSDNFPKESHSALCFLKASFNFTYLNQKDTSSPQTPNSNSDSGSNSEAHSDHSVSLHNSCLDTNLIVRTLASIAEQPDNQIRNPVIELLSELLILNPQSLISNNALKVLINNAVDGPYHISIIIVSAFLHLIDSPKNRAFTLLNSEFEPVLFPLTSDSFNNKLNQEQEKIAVYILSQLFKSWAGLSYIISGKCLIIKSILLSMESSSEHRIAILSFLFEIFGFSSLLDSTKSLQNNFSAKVISNINKIADLPSDITHFTSSLPQEFRPIEYFRSILLSLFLEFGLFKSLTLALYTETDNETIEAIAMLITWLTYSPLSKLPKYSIGQIQSQLDFPISNSNSFKVLENYVLRFNLVMDNVKNPFSDIVETSEGSSVNPKQWIYKNLYSSLLSYSPDSSTSNTDSRFLPKYFIKSPSISSPLSSYHVSSVSTKSSAKFRSNSDTNNPSAVKPNALATDSASANRYFGVFSPFGSNYSTINVRRGSFNSDKTRSSLGEIHSRAEFYSHSRSTSFNIEKSEPKHSILGSGFSLNSLAPNSLRVSPSSFFSSRLSDEKAKIEHDSRLSPVPELSEEVESNFFLYPIENGHVVPDNAKGNRSLESINQLSPTRSQFGSVRHNTQAKNDNFGAQSLYSSVLNKGVDTTPKRYFLRKQNYLNKSYVKSDFHSKLTQVKLLIERSFVLKKEHYTDWNWETITRLLFDDTLLESSILSELLTDSLFFHRLARFYMPTGFDFCGMGTTKISVSSGEAGIQLVKILMSSGDGMLFLDECNLVSDIVFHLKELICVNSSFNTRYKTNSSEQHIPLPKNLLSPNIKNQSCFVLSNIQSNPTTKMYFNMLNQLSKSKGGMRLLEHQGLFDTYFKLLDSEENVDVCNLIKYISGSINCDSCGYGRLIIEKIASSPVESYLLELFPFLFDFATYRYTHTADVFAKSTNSEPDLLSWTFNILRRLLLNQHTSVCIKSVQTIVNIFNFYERQSFQMNECLSGNVSNSKCGWIVDMFFSNYPNLVLVEPHVARPLLLKLASFNNGVEYLQSLDLLDPEMELWKAELGIDYVFESEILISKELSAGPLFCPAAIGKTTNTLPNSITCPIPSVMQMHLFGQLSMCQSGMNYLRDSEIFSLILETLDNIDANSLDDEDILALKATIHAVCSIGVSEIGYLEMKPFNVIEKLLDMAKNSNTATIKGTCIFGLGKISKNVSASKDLEKYGWEFCYSSNGQYEFALPGNIKEVLEFSDWQIEKVLDPIVPKSGILESSIVFIKTKDQKKEQDLKKVLSSGNISDREGSESIFDIKKKYMDLNADNNEKDSSELRDDTNDPSDPSAFLKKELISGLGQPELSILSYVCCMTTHMLIASSCKNLTMLRTSHPESFHNPKVLNIVLFIMSGFKFKASTLKFVLGLFDISPAVYFNV